ncbi:ATP-binding protein [Micromonospora sp. NBC_01796]|uniref:ATP-binding protein n=1 Tax=Micromonospora sp. NBC_01796 TaxID=2975987 RepID=UPI002DDA3B9B|nr:ATP-binding protein [Micromonospora sp. NBC_01796]WSA86953.1 AAA family ATPase [Micromonospora sp. NBC_01796]
MVAFVGRHRELRVLAAELERIAPGDSRPGRCLLIRGRRRVGKSRLVEQFVENLDAPSVYFTAAGSPTPQEVRRFCADVAESPLPGRELLAAANPEDWDSALRLLAAALPEDGPSVVVIDEVPYLMDGEHVFEGVLQRAWDRQLSRKPVLLILIGSDLSMMEALNSYERPFHQRGREMVVGPLNPADLSTMLEVDAAEAIDATLVTGGLPLVCTEWQPGTDVWDFLTTALADPTSALLVSAERSLAAEFPAAVQARAVLAAIGSGERTFANIARASGGLGATPLQRSLDVLNEKRLVVGDLPLSTRPSKERRYRIADPYLRFWLHFIAPYMAEIERGRGDLTLARIRRGWTSWRGRAVEPLVRDALSRLLPDGTLPAAGAVGSYWTRANDVEVDIVGADRGPIARELLFVGSIKWLDQATFDAHDLAVLHRHRAALTDQPLPILAVSRSGVSCGGLDAAYGPEDLLAAWRSTESR